MTRWIGWTAFTALIIAFSAATGVAKDDVEIRLSGRYYAEPATVQMIVAVEPHAANRVLRVEADGDNMFCSTDVPLEGAKEARLHTIRFTNLAAGEYTLRAQVLSTDTVRAETTADLMVTGRDMDVNGGW